jgi:hypothetical protein
MRFEAEQARKFRDLSGDYVDTSELTSAKRRQSFVCVVVQSRCLALLSRSKSSFIRTGQPWFGLQVLPGPGGWLSWRLIH